MRQKYYLLLAILIISLGFLIGAKAGWADNSFRPDVDVLSPNGGENFALGEAIPARWTQTFSPREIFGETTRVSVIGANSVAIYDSPPLSSLSGENTWSLPTNAVTAAGSYRLKVCSEYWGVNHCDRSDGNFTVTAPLVQPTIAVSNSTLAPARTIMVNAREILGGFKVTVTGEPITVNNMVFVAYTGVINSASGPISGLSLVNENGVTVAGPVNAVLESSGAASLVSQKFTFPDTVIFPVGAHAYTIRGKAPLTFADNSTIYLVTTPSSGWTSAHGQTTDRPVNVSAVPAVTMSVMTVAAVAPPVIPASITPQNSTVASGQSLNFNLAVSAARHDQMRLRLVCPGGVSVFSSSNQEICNRDLTLSVSVNQYGLRFINTTGERELVIVRLWPINRPPYALLHGDMVSANVWVEPATLVQPSLAASLLNAFEDRASVWHKFSPGIGNANKNAADWNWRASLTLSGQKTIERMTILHNTSGERWSTGFSKVLKNGADLFPGREEHPYPLVVIFQGQKLNQAYDQVLGTYGVSPIHVFTLSGQIESPQFSGGKLIVEFTDGTNIMADIPASSHRPPVVTSTGPTYVAPADAASVSYYDLTANALNAVNQDSGSSSGSNSDSLSAELNQLRSIIREQQNQIQSLTALIRELRDSSQSRFFDSDGDLLTDARERELGTDPNNRDTDGDGHLDGIEVANGYNPLGYGR